MAISGINNLPYGTIFQSGKPEQIVSDGRVDERFVKDTPDFISDIADVRVQAFCAQGTAPGETWQPHPLGGFDSQHQSIFLDEGRVVLRSNGDDDKRHLINAPFGEAGAIDVETSSEGFDTKPHEGTHTKTFKIPVAGQFEIGGVFDLDDPNSLGQIFGQ